MQRQCDCFEAAGSLIWRHQRGKITMEIAMIWCWKVGGGIVGGGVGGGSEGVE